MSKGFAKADRVRTEVPGKRRTATGSSRTRGIPGSDHTERDDIVRRMKKQSKGKG